MRHDRGRPAASAGTGVCLQHQPDVVVIPIADRPMWAVKRANLRIGPGTSFAKIGLLEVGEEVRITGEAGRWLRVELSSGRNAFVYGPLLSSRPAADEARADAPGTEAGATRRRHQLARHGRQVMTYNHGRYEGEVRDGKRHGRRIMTWLNGHRYEGEWRNDRRHGRGTYTWPSGMRYEGKWSNGKKHGRGTYVSADGAVAEGTWRNDRMVRRSEPSPEHRQRQTAARRKPTPGVIGELWGALVWDFVDENTYWNETDRHTVYGRCTKVAGMAWNYPTMEEAVRAAVEQCRQQWRETGFDVPLIYTRSGDGYERHACGNIQRPFNRNHWRLSVFGSHYTATCAAYAQGTFPGSARCPLHGLGLGETKSDAEREAIDHCAYDSCRITMSQCLPAR